MIVVSLALSRCGERRIWWGRAFLVLLLLAGAANRTEAQTAGADGAGASDGLRIIISIEQRRLWLIEGRDTILSVPAAVGRGETVELNGRRHHFATPRGQRRVLAKERDPLWTPPDWHYYEKADARGLEVVMLDRGKRYPLGDGTYLEIRGDQVGRVNRFGSWWPWTPGMEIIFDGKLFVPPFGTAQRKVPDALGRFKLDLGDGYLIHGTHVYNRDSIGQAVSHGCVRLEDDALEQLFERVEVGTPVYIY